MRRRFSPAFALPLAIAIGVLPLGCKSTPSDGGGGDGEPSAGTTGTGDGAGAGDGGASATTDGGTAATTAPEDEEASLLAWAAPAALAGGPFAAFHATTDPILPPPPPEPVAPAVAEGGGEGEVGETAGVGEVSDGPVAGGGTAGEKIDDDEELPSDPEFGSGIASTVWGNAAPATIQDEAIGRYDLVAFRRVGRDDDLGRAPGLTLLYERAGEGDAPRCVSVNVTDWASDADARGALRRACRPAVQPGGEWAGVEEVREHSSRRSIAARRGGVIAVIRSADAGEGEPSEAWRSTLAALTRAVIDSVEAAR